ncbi:MAG TPA: hypothetical protein VM818_05680 [Vicinamibacterales bacterium]|nr:hypothetical protein [Vicinamibacterales bacterium]
MTRTLPGGLFWAAVLAFAMPVAPRAQVVVTPAPTPQPQQIVVTPDSRNAQDVRGQLNELLRNYPPSVAQVLRLDPSLLTREGYLAPYPALAAFLAQHPEIALQPTFYLGSPRFEEPNDPTSQVMRGFENMVAYVTLLGGFVGAFLLVGWLARLAVEHRRWLRAAKTQTEAHSKLLDRLTSNDDLIAYIQSPAGQHFLQSAPIPLDAGPRAMGAPFGRILWSVQAGIVLAVVGLGLWFVRNTVIDEVARALNVIAVLIVALGVGFTLSAGVAYLLSQRLGLLEPPK